MNATAYLRAVRARIPDENSDYEPRAVVSLVEGMNEKNFGAAGRNHIFESLSKKSIVWNSLASNSIGITWE
jgi:hypothetical protein